ncbi:hypothetical protein YTPLAS72_10180 [Nitrospira sp.]|nr:hypothetical protein YTPLAS72_10180 [Nitrospira sp.]
MIPDRPFSTKPIDESRTIERIGPNSQHQRRLSDDFVSTKTEELETRVIDLQTASSLKFRDTDRVGTQAKGFGKELIRCRFGRPFLPISWVKDR